MIRQHLQSIKNDSLFGVRTKIGYYLFLLLIVFGFFIVIVSITSVPYYRILIKEDGIIEDASALFWLFAAFTTIFMLWKIRNKNSLFLPCYLLLLLFFIACCGEEISWGQRLFHVHGPSTILEINKQNELNLHDIGHISIFSNAFFLIYLCFFFVYPYLYDKFRIIKDWVVRYQLPVVNYQMISIAFFVIIIWVIIGVRFGTLGFHPYSVFGYYTQMDDEIFEFLAAYSFWCFAILDFKIKCGHR